MFCASSASVSSFFFPFAFPFDFRVIWRRNRSNQTHPSTARIVNQTNSKIIFVMGIKCEKKCTKIKRKKWAYKDGQLVLNISIFGILAFFFGAHHFDIDFSAETPGWWSLANILRYWIHSFSFVFCMFVFLYSPCKPFNLYWCSSLNVKKHWALKPEIPF